MLKFSASHIYFVVQAPLTAYVHSKRGEVRMRMDAGYELPELVSGLVDFISDFNAFEQGKQALT